MKRAMFFIGVLCVLATVGAVTARGSSQVEVGFLGCALGNGPTTAPAGSAITLRVSWFASTRDFVQDFVDSSQITFSINGRNVPGTRQYWTTPSLQPDGGWRSDWLYPTGIALAKKATLTATWEDVLRHAVQDGTPEGVPAGSMFVGPIRCTVRGT